MALQHTAHNQAADGHGGLAWHANQPRKPVLFHATPVLHTPGMYEYRDVESLALGPERFELGRIQVPIVDMATDLDASESEFLHAATKFDDGQAGILHREGAKACKVLWVLG